MHNRKHKTHLHKQETNNIQHTHTINKQRNKTQITQTHTTYKTKHKDRTNNIYKHKYIKTVSIVNNDNNNTYQQNKTQQQTHTTKQLKYNKQT